MDYKNITRFYKHEDDSQFTIKLALVIMHFIIQVCSDNIKVTRIVMLKPNNNVGINANRETTAL